MITLTLSVTVLDPSYYSTEGYLEDVLENNKFDLVLVCQSTNLLNEKLYKD